MSLKYKKSNVIRCAVIMGIMLSLTGCGLDPMPDLTADERAMISEYAVGI